MIAFFCCISQLKMEGVFIGFSMLELREEHIKIGELWLNNDGDDIYILNLMKPLYIFMI